MAQFSLDSMRRARLATCIAAALTISSPLALAATTWTVNSCNQANSGSGTTGTLRYAVANAASGDTLDMTGLSCSTISLTTGAINVIQNDLTVKGPGMDKLTITGKYNGVTEHDRIINHTGTGTLSLYDLSLSKGYLVSATGTARGGCVNSTGSVFMSHVGTYFCQARTTSGTAVGGGIHAQQDLVLKYSVLANNSAYGGSSGSSAGGGAMSLGGFTAKYSAISGNIAQGASGNATGIGGGLDLRGNVSISNSTIAGNQSGYNVGGIAIADSSARTQTTTIKNSTISGNSAGNLIGGMYVNSGTVNVQNSTIAFNTASQGRVGASFPYTYYAPGVATSDFFGATTVTLQSTLIANNTYGNPTPHIEYDLSVPTRASTTVSFSGANNLVRATFAAVPADTIKLACPLLGSLRFNGGPTQTHALLSHSPGIDQGNNSASATYDQRGSPSTRVSGMATDIGAYEVQQNDIVFNANFEDCPLLF